MINKNNIEKMLEMPDERLWAMLKLVLTSAGVNVSGKQLDPKSIKKVRAILKEVTDDDIDRVMYLADIYKNGG